MTTVVVIVLIKLRKVVLRMDRTGNPIARFVYLAHHSKTSFKTFEIKWYNNDVTRQTGILTNYLKNWRSCCSKT